MKKMLAWILIFICAICEISAIVLQITTPEYANPLSLILWVAITSLAFGGTLLIKNK